MKPLCATVALAPLWPLLPKNGLDLKAKIIFHHLENHSAFFGHLLYYKTLGILTWTCVFSETVVTSDACCV